MPMRHLDTQPWLAGCVLVSHCCLTTPVFPAASPGKWTQGQNMAELGFDPMSGYKKRAVRMRWRALTKDQTIF